MKRGFYQATIAVAGSLALTAILQNSSVSDAIVEGALTGGGLWATATASVGNFGQGGLTVHQ
jgi:hypothetical protein